MSALLVPKVSQTWGCYSVERLDSPDLLSLQCVRWRSPSPSSNLFSSLMMLQDPNSGEMKQTPQHVHCRKRNAVLWGILRNQNTYVLVWDDMGETADVFYFRGKYLGESIL